MICNLLLAYVDTHVFDTNTNEVLVLVQHYYLPKTLDIHDNSFRNISKLTKLVFKVTYAMRTSMRTKKPSLQKSLHVSFKICTSNYFISTNVFECSYIMCN